METGSEEFAKSIGSAAQDRLAKSTRGMTYTLQEQGGVKIAEDDSLKLSPEIQTRVTSLLGITELASQLRHSLFEKAAQGQMTDSSKLSPEQKVIANQDKFIQELLGNNPKLLDKLAEITAKARVLNKVLKDQEANTVTEGLRIKAVAWEHTIDEIAQSLCSNEAERAYYQQLVESNLVKLNNPTTRTVKGADGQPATTTHKSYAQRLDKLIQKPRAAGLISFHLEPHKGETLADNLMDEYLETAFTLNAVRVLDRIQRPLDFNGKFRKLTACLEGYEADPVYTSMIKANNLGQGFNRLRDEIAQTSRSALSEDAKKQKIQQLNDQFKEGCRPAVEASFNKKTDTDEAIDLVSTRQRIITLQQQAQQIQASNLDEAEKKQRLADLDRQMQALFVPIANKVDRVFPHQNSTNLSKVLEEEDAICAGKVNVLLAISKYLGINARANLVIETLDNGTEGHVCFECDLPSGNKLVIDANFRNSFYLAGLTDGEIATLIRKNNPNIKDSEFESDLRYEKLIAANARCIPTNSRVLIYMTENISQVAANEDQLQQARQNPRLLVSINPYSGQQEIWRATIPYPHLITSPDKDGYLFINSSFTNNTAHFARMGDEDISVYLFRKHIEMNPYDARAYIGLARLLPKEEGLASLEKVRKEKPTFYWESMSIDHALMYAHQENPDMALQVFEETKVRNPRNYYKNIHYLSKQFIFCALKRPNEADKYKAHALSIMEQARRDNPALFYSNPQNIWEIVGLYGGQTERKVKIYEEFRRVQESAFWYATGYSSPFQQLVELYLEQSKNDPTSHNKAVEFVNEIKSREKRFYVERVNIYASGLYLTGKQKDPAQAIAMLEEAKAESPEIFFQNGHNITTLANTYERQGSDDRAIVLYEEFRIANPDLFWNQKYDPIYENLVHLYTRTHQVDKAISICEEAKDKNQKFWEPSYNGGYIQLVNLYSEAGRLPEAIAIGLEAQTKDPNFFNPKLDTEGGYVQLASAYDKSGQSAEAISTMLRGQETDKGFWTTYGTPPVFKLVDFYERSGQINKAISVLEQVKDRNSSYWKTDYYRICGLYEKNGDVEKARQIRRELIGIYEGLKSSDPNTYYASTEKLANLYLSEGQTQRAIQALEEGKANNVYFPIRAIVFLADLYVQVGDRDKAKLAYQEAVEDYKKFGRPENVPVIIERAKSKGIDLTGE